MKCPKCGAEVNPNEVHTYGKCEDCWAGKLPGSRVGNVPWSAAADIKLTEQNNRRRTSEPEDK